MMKSIPSGTQTFTRRVPGIVIPVIKKQGRLRVPKRTVFNSQVQLAPAFYVGWQEGATEQLGFPLYTLIEEIPGHSQWSTVSGKTLEDAGFILPTRRAGWEQNPWGKAIPEPSMIEVSQYLEAAISPSSMT